VNIHDALDKFFREQADSTNLIETMWLLFAASVKIPAGGAQWTESRRCFFAGAATLFEALTRIMEPGAEPTDADVARMDRISKELDRYMADMKAGRA
jgi:hypothetical protein